MAAVRLQRADPSYGESLFLVWLRKPGAAQRADKRGRPKLIGGRVDSDDAGPGYLQDVGRDNLRTRKRPQREPETDLRVLKKNA